LGGGWEEIPLLFLALPKHRLTKALALRRLLKESSLRESPPKRPCGDKLNLSSFSSLKTKSVLREQDKAS
jgi:hypothetical protein